MTKKLIYISSILLVIALIAIGLGLSISRADDLVDVSQARPTGGALERANVVLQKNVTHGTSVENKLLLTLETDLSSLVLNQLLPDGSVQLDSAAALEGRLLALVEDDLLENSHLYDSLGRSSVAPLTV